MSDPHVFVVRLWAATPPTQGFRGSVRPIQTEDTITVRTPNELARAMLSTLKAHADPVPPSASPPHNARNITGKPRARDSRPWVAALAVGTALALGGAMWLSLDLPAPPVATLLPLVLLAITGLLSGFLSGLLGIGGALVVVPAMYLLLPWLGIAAERLPYVVVGTSLLAMMPTALAATIAQYRLRCIEIAWLSRLAPGMVIGAAVGALFAMQLRGPALSLLFASQSFYFGWQLLRKARPPSNRIGASAIRSCSRAPGWLASPLIAAFCACAGMGAGSMIAPYLMGKGVSMLRATATSSPLNLCIAVGGGLALIVPQQWTMVSAVAPSVSWQAAAIVGGCAVLTVRQGVALAHSLPVELFRKTLGCVTLLGASVLTLRTAWFCF